LIYTLAKLRDIGHQDHRLLLTKVPPAPRRKGSSFALCFIADKVPVFKAEVPTPVAFRDLSPSGRNHPPEAGD
jgi:hypothetical protein